MSVTLPPPAAAPVRGKKGLDTRTLRTSGPMALSFLSILAFVGAFGAWSFMVPLSEAAVAPGVIKAEGSRRTIAHLEGGIVRELLTHDGMVVKAGQVLLRLDDTQAASGRDNLRAQQWELVAQDSRIQAELAETPITFPPSLLAAEDQRARDAVAGQRAQFLLKQASLASSIQVLEARINQYTASGTAAEAQIGSQRRQLELLRREEGDVRGLVAQGLERMPRLLALQRQLASSEGNIADLRAQAERARAQKAEAESQIRQTRDQRMQEASAEARDVRAKLADVEERLRAADDVSDRREIVAPEDGTVINSRFFNPGAVVRPGEAVMELVPARDRLVAEVKLSPSDIDVVHTGLSAEVRLPAFKQRLVPYLHGEVILVGGDVTAEERTMQEYYRVQISIDQEQLDRLDNVVLRAGMPVEAQIQIGERSFVRYMVQPLIDSFHRAFREQ